ncbi:MAG: IS4 family transposase [Campylobacterales bacterium]|nr:IS4 family transposase [Campylobacterales bacterium]
MNHNKKHIKLQEKILVNNLKNKDSSFWNKLFRDNKLDYIIDKYSINSRKRIYTPKKTLGMFLSQAIEEDSSCKKVICKTSLNSSKIISSKTGGYCKARKRLNETMISDMCKDLAKNSLKKIKNTWRFRNKNVYLIDGTTITMPDTKENQKSYPQSRTQKEGLGFPICRIVCIISLETGCIVNAAVSTYAGKGASEQTLLRSMLGTFKKGDILLADAMYSTYFLLDYLIEQEIDIVFSQNGARSRKTDFTKGKYIGNNDHIIIIKKTKEIPNWMDKNTFNNKSNELKIREVKVCNQILITTFCDEKDISLKEIKELYKQRWHIEVDFRNIKSTLGLFSFSCKTPEMVLKEMWVYFLAYNFIRNIIVDSAIQNKIYPRDISFKHTIQLLIASNQNINKKQYKKLLYLISLNIIGNRKGRIEPRAIKRRHNAMPLLTKPRHVAQANIRQFGHPKKA